ncbi:hypothetical protein LG200_08640 [Methylobacillus caricis]|uniref:hypothetical protein n=1 Tax=Methylobacillus caricis TaxID=1971611 RepID=UPI001CFFA2C6|nr:hypothetical protein [Methylobacillus caricis]MCB5188069.1 hypothetical protein [Methylobacillus caricis]
MLSALTILQKDMVVENEGIPEGSDKFAWAYKPTLIMGYNPTASGIPSWYPGKRFAVWDRALGWVTAYREKGAANPVNTRLALKDFYLYYFSKSKKQWVLLEYLPNIKEDYRGEANMEVTNAPSTFDVRTESDGIKSYKMAPGSWFHTYGYLKNFELSDFGGLYYRFDFKLVLDNPKGPNTLNSDKWLVQSGADYYPVEYPKESLGAPYNPGVGTGRFLRAGPQWRTSTFLVMTPPYTLSQYPPNLDNFYE